MEYKLNDIIYNSKTDSCYIITYVYLEHEKHSVMKKLLGEKMYKMQKLIENSDSNIDRAFTLYETNIQKTRIALDRDIENDLIKHIKSEFIINNDLVVSLDENDKYLCLHQYESSLILNAQEALELKRILNDVLI